MSEKMISRRDFLVSGLFVGLPALLIDPRGVLAQTDAESVTPKGTKGTPMEEGRPSVTARGPAIHRAAHQLLEVPKIFDDPVALRMIGTDAESRVRANLWRFQKSRLLRAFIVLRSRYAEDELASAVQRGVRQYVILGAGLDTFGYRNPYQESRLHVFEVDHPATQSWKRVRLQEANIAIP